MTKLISITDAEFSKTVTEAGGPLLIEYWADDCPPCKVIATWLQQIAQEYEKRLQVVTVEAPHNPAACAAFDVRQVPTLLFLRNGKLVRRQAGRITEAELRQQVAQLCAPGTGGFLTILI